MLRCTHDGDSLVIATTPAEDRAPARTLAFAPDPGSEDDRRAQGAQAAAELARTLGTKKTTKRHRASSLSEVYGDVCFGVLFTHLPSAPSSAHDRASLWRPCLVSEPFFCVSVFVRCAAVYCCCSGPRRSSSDNCLQFAVCGGVWNSFAFAWLFLNSRRREQLGGTVSFFFFCNFRETAQRARRRQESAEQEHTSHLSSCPSSGTYVRGKQSKLCVVGKVGELAGHGCSLGVRTSVFLAIASTVSGTLAAHAKQQHTSTPH